MTDNTMMAGQAATDGQEQLSATDGGDSLGSEFVNRGLSLSPLTGTLPSFDEPLSAVGFATADRDGQPLVAAAVLAGDGLEAFDLTVAAIQAANLDLVPATAVSIESIDELTATVQQPHELLVVRAGSEVVGVVVRHADRRSADGDRSEAGPSGRVSPGPVGPAEPTAGGSGAMGGLGLLQDVVLEVSVELGRTALPLSQLMNLGIGSVVELDRNAGAPVDVRVNGTLFAKGEVVVVEGEYAVRIIEILPPQGH